MCLTHHTTAPWDKHLHVPRAWKKSDWLKEQPNTYIIHEFTPEESHD